jgi:hypothetical protein
VTPVLQRTNRSSRGPELLAQGLDAGVEGDRVWMTCTCGALLVRLVPFS